MAMADAHLLQIKLVSLALIMHLLLFSHHHEASAQQDIFQMAYRLCSPNGFSSTFYSNLNIVFATLSLHTGSSLYYNASRISNSSSSSTDNVYAMYQCRGDLPLSKCSSCVSSIIQSDPLPCGAVSGMRIQLLGCYLRYEYNNFLTGSDYTFVNRTCSSSTNSNSSFQSNLASVLNATATAAPLNNGFNASSRVSTGRQDYSAYALAQCLGYLTPTQCATCLSQVSSYNIPCPNAVAGAVYYITCYYLYSDSPLLLSSTGWATLPTSLPTNPSEKGGSKIPVVAGILVAGVILLAALGALFLFRRRNQTTNKSLRTDDCSGLQQRVHLAATRFSLVELRQATENFDSKNKLGEGGFGPVYKGRLTNNKEVAIKMLSSKSQQGKEEFLNEVNFLANVQHRNLIELLGCCVEHRLLVYEYLPNRSLDLHLFEDATQQTLPNWRTRMQIIIGIARGLVYLHEDSNVKVVHRDIKTSNILLDDNFNPKISDFGLARFFNDDVTHMTTQVAGTMGYLAPEYAANGKLTKKVDIYSFGIVALEIVSGRRFFNQQLPEEEEQLLAWAWTLYERQQQLQILDPKLVNTEVNEEDVIRVVHVALLCTQTWPGSRPTISQVFSMLCGPSLILTLPTKPTHNEL